MMKWKLCVTIKEMADFYVQTIPSGLWLKVANNTAEMQLTVFGG